MTVCFFTRTTVWLHMVIFISHMILCTSMVLGGGGDSIATEQVDHSIVNANSWLIDSIRKDLSLCEIQLSSDHYHDLSHCISAVHEIIFFLRYAFPDLKNEEHFLTKENVQRVLNHSFVYLVSEGLKILFKHGALTQETFTKLVNYPEKFFIVLLHKLKFCDKNEKILSVESFLVMCVLDDSDSQSYLRVDSVSSVDADDCQNREILRRNQARYKEYKINKLKNIIISHFFNETCTEEDITSICERLFSFGDALVLWILTISKTISTFQQNCKIFLEKKEERILLVLKNALSIVYFFECLTAYRFTILCAADDNTIMVINDILNEIVSCCGSYVNRGNSHTIIDLCFLQPNSFSVKKCLENVIINEHYDFIDEDEDEDEGIDKNIDFKHFIKQLCFEDTPDKKYFFCCCCLFLKKPGFFFHMYDSAELLSIKEKWEYLKKHEFNKKNMKKVCALIPVLYSFRLLTQYNYQFLMAKTVSELSTIHEEIQHLLAHTTRFRSVTNYVRNLILSQRNICVQNGEANRSGITHVAGRVSRAFTSLFCRCLCLRNEDGR